MTGFEPGDRIAIIGPSSSGKSTLATLFAAAGYPVLHLDQVAHLPGTAWERADNAVLVARHDSFIEQKRWVVEGNYSVCLPQRLARADTLLWLDPPLIGCLWRQLLRGPARPGGLKGAPAGFSLELARYTLVQYPRNAARYREMIARHPHLRQYHLTSFADIKALAKGLQS